jgi:hypothetical protein
MDNTPSPSDREAFEAWWAGSGFVKFKDTAEAAWLARAALSTPAEVRMLTDAEIDAIWRAIPPQRDPTGQRFYRTFARAIAAASVNGLKIKESGNG